MGDYLWGHTGAGRLGLWTLHGANLVYEGIVAYVRGGEGLARQIHNPVTELIVTRRDKSTPRAIKGVEYRELGIVAVTVFGGVLGIEAIAQKGGISPFLRSQLRPIYF